MTPQQYCQNKAAKSGSSFYYSFLFLSPPQREAITAVYAFCREVDDVVDRCNDTSVAQTTLQWWEHEVHRIFEGQPEHPIGMALSEILKKYRIPKNLFLDIIQGVRCDLVNLRYSTWEDLKQYCYQVASVVGLMSIEIFGYRHVSTRLFAENLGQAFQLTNILRDVREDFLRHRIYIPLEAFQELGIQEKDLGLFKTNHKLQQLFSLVADKAKLYYRQAFTYLHDEDRYAQRSGIIMAEIYQSLLHEIDSDGFHVLEKRIRLTPLRKLWLAWNTARREKKRYKRMVVL